MTTSKLTCYTMKMNQFIRVLLGQETLTEWEEIYSEYIGLRENKSSSFILELMKSITYLQTKQFIITKCVEVLAHTYNDELVTELKLTGCKGKFNWEDKAGYSNDLRAATSYSKKFTSQIIKKEKELEEYNKRHGNKGIERKDFDIWAVTLSKYLGYRVDYDITTVSEWCVIMNQYERYCEVSNAEDKNLLNGRRPDK